MKVGESQADKTLLMLHKAALPKLKTMFRSVHALLTKIGHLRIICGCAI